MLSHSILQPFIQPLEDSRILYFVTGSIAAIFYGEPRLTHDIDIVLHLPTVDVQKFSTLFPLTDFYCPPEEVLHIETRRTPTGHFNLIHHTTGFKADIYTDSGDPLHQWAFQNRKHVELSKHLSTWIAPVEYLIIRKLEYFREGGSQKHLDDIAKMLPQIGSKLDFAFLDAEIRKRMLTSFWEQVSSRTKINP